MSVPYRVITETGVFTVVDDQVFVFQALVTGLVQDEITGEGLPKAFELSAGRDDVRVRTMQAGLFGIAGYADRVFPDLATAAQTLHLSITAPGFRNGSLDVTLSAGAQLPVTAPPVALRRLP